MILGIDIGTSVTKAALIERGGGAMATASRKSVVKNYPGGQVEQDLDDVIGSVIDVARTVLAQTNTPVEAVAITGQGDGLWLRDDAGKATRAPISWMDARASHLVNLWREGGDESIVNKVFALTGSGIFPGSHAALIAHLSQTEPESLAAATVAGYCVDAVLQRIAGVTAVDASDASLPFLDVTTRTYVGEALALCGISQWRHLLTEPSPPHTIHHLDADGAQLLGLPEGTPVSAGPYDLQACGFGAGATRVGQGTLVVGTTLSCQTLTDNATIKPLDEPAGMWLATPDPTVFLHVMPSMVGTASIDWLLGIIGAQPQDLDSLLGLSVPGQSSVRSLSFFSSAGERAPFVDPELRAQFVGLSLESTRADLVRSLCESIAYAAKNCFEALELTGELSGCGGGLRSAELAQIFADVMGRPLHVPIEEMAGIRGAAAVAWESLGSPVDLDVWNAKRRVFTPRAHFGHVYEAGYATYLADVAAARGSTQL